MTNAKRIVILGATGSIGVQALNVIAASEELEVVALSAQSNWEPLLKLAQRFGVKRVALSNEDAAAQAEGNVALNLILLYRALGGGWQIRLGQGEFTPNAGDCHSATPPPYPVGREACQDNAQTAPMDNSLGTIGRPVLLQPDNAGGISAKYQKSLPAQTTSPESHASEPIRGLERVR